MTGIAERIYFRSPVWLQNILVSTYGYHLFQQRFGGSFKKVLKEVERTHELSSRQIHELQSERLHSMVRYCHECIPYYRKVMADYGLSPTDFTTVEHLQKLPMLKKETVKTKPDLFRPQKPIKVWMKQHTSGSTGTPLALDVDEYTYKLAMALLVDHEQRAGVPFGAPRATFAGRMLQPFEDETPPFSRYNRAENQRLFSSYHLSEKTFDDYNRELTGFQPKELIGYPSVISLLAGFYQQTGVTPTFSPSAVITNSETLLDWQKEKIESVFKCPVRDYYGTAEYVIFAGQRDDGYYHPNPLLGIMETADLDSDSDEQLVLGTTLTNRAMPLLRYDLGDTAVVANNYEQGYTPSLVKCFSGRKDDYIITPSGRKIGRTGEIFGYFPEVKEAQIIQTSASKVHLAIVPELKSEINNEAIIELCKKKLSSEFTYEIETVPKIPRSKNGKFKSVINEITS
ncbi:hypothetical protein CF392_02530 [Tamilnaduibacter salinus]|uniref:Phenylacetate-CoA ligase n=1 Tax=Tamilnaduibacter salinus TaxID=1484056 RepID=A0A2A2I627_9GAMM|nr:phenylacetate--CoA ligase family protein [Tamilnaduibacter salinus]PAV27032.1 hypothetical protein CF392_02530 [Tamilnaduibacter salinus]